jgi:hypothetical protein
MSDGRMAQVERELSRAPILPAFGIAFLALGLLLGIAYWFGGVRSSLFPTGWLFSAILLATGALMTTRRRFDIVMTLWGGMLAATFLLDFSVYMQSLEFGIEQPAGYDASIIVAVFALVPLILRPQFRD